MVWGLLRKTACLGRGGGWEDIPGHRWDEGFGAPRRVRTRGPAASHAGSHVAPLDFLAPLRPPRRDGAPFPVAGRQLALPPPSTHPFGPPHPAMVFISPGPRRAYLQQALGKMAALGDGQDPPRVPSPGHLASPGTPGTHRLEARLHFHGHQHGTHPALHSLRPPAPPARPAPPTALHHRQCGRKQGSSRLLGLLHPCTWVRMRAG